MLTRACIVQKRGKSCGKSACTRGEGCCLASGRIGVFKERGVNRCRLHTCVFAGLERVQRLHKCVCRESLHRFVL